MLIEYKGVSACDLLEKLFFILSIENWKVIKKSMSHIFD